MGKFCYGSDKIIALGECLYAPPQSFEIVDVASSSNPKNHALIFANRIGAKEALLLNAVKKSVIILREEDHKQLKQNSNMLLLADNPRQLYAQILTEIMKHQEPDLREYVSEKGYVVGQNTIIGEKTLIEPFVFIDHDVSIGKHCIIRKGASIRSGTVIGDHTIIMDNSVVGADGFGVENGINGANIKIPHLGGVQIGNHVEIGAGTVICRGTITNTMIESHVKIDGLVFVAHNCHIESGSLLIAHSEISGSVRIGRNSWVAPSVCIREGITVGEGAMLGMGSVVVKDVQAHAVIVGNPGRSLR